MNTVRVRFAPSPTGFMHLGSVRIALFNYLFAQKYTGTFIIRIEDTDPERNFDPGAYIILDDLSWLSLAYQEGPLIGGSYEPYYQSQRTELYQEKLRFLQEHNYIYRCFCTEKELEKKRIRQQALKQAPRYDRTCLQLPQATIETLLEKNMPYIWRFKVDQQMHIAIKDIARGGVTFDMSHFSDFPVTRSTGTFTFLFANAIDDMIMNISHVIRGEDHISNTPLQALLFQAFNHQLPIFWHMPIICNTDGKKLSKRDFGFALRDLRQAGFLPEALCNYLAIIGGSYEKEIMSINELINSLDFNNIHAASTIRYDVEKLRWVNHQWIQSLSPEECMKRTMPFIHEKYPAFDKLDTQKCEKLIRFIQPELKTLAEAPSLVAFYFDEPNITQTTLRQYAPEEQISVILQWLKNNMALLENVELFLKQFAQMLKQEDIAPATAWKIMRLLLTGSPEGPRIKDLLTLLDTQKTTQRIKTIIAS